ncbi:MAG: SH3 domain-containing protein [Pseudomonadota bacterium]
MTMKRSSLFYIEQSPLQILMLFAAVLTLFVYNSLAFAANKPNLPRFAITKSNEVNARTGPGVRYPTEWIFIKKGEPLEITAEFEQWRYVRDITGDVGWVHSSVLSGKRSVVILGTQPQNLHYTQDQTSRVVATLEPNLRCQLKSCKINACKLKCSSYVGWVPHKYLWGVKQGEVF